MNLKAQIEAILFSAEEPVTAEDITAFMTNRYGLEYSVDEILSCIEESINSYEIQDSPFGIFKIGGGYLFKSKTDYHSLIASFLQRNTIKKLTKAALETLAIIAYRQPVTKSEIDLIRGVSSDYTVQKLMERDLVELKGRSSEVGKPLLYGTTGFFLDYFGINNLEELPRLKELTQTENQIGEQEEIIQEN